MRDEFEVGEFRVAVKLNRISQNGHTTRVEPKVMQVLTCLAERPGEVVSKDLLMQTVWAETHVTDDVLTGCISTLRKVFRDSAREPNFIETIPKGGYRLIAPVQFTHGNKSAAVAAVEIPQPLKGNRKPVWWILSCAVLVVVLAATWLWARAHRPAIDSVAILPFASSNPDSEYLGDGISESIIDSISQLPALRVMSWSAVSHYRGPTTDPLKIGRDLGVSAVLTGQIVQRDDHVLIQTELVDLGSGTQLWGEQYDRKASDLIPLQKDIAHQISEKLRLRLTGDDQKKLAKQYTADPEAYRLYLKGRYFWNKRSQEGMKKAIDYFQQAIDRDPTYALAYAGLADSYDLLDDWGTTPPRESFPKARAAALRALELDDSLAEAHTSLAFVEDNYDWNFAASEKEFQRAIALNPNYATAHQWYAMHLVALGRFHEAEAEIQRAVDLDPLSVIITMGVAEISGWERKYDAATEQFRKTLELDPNFIGAHGNLADAYEKQGNYKQAEEEGERTENLSGDPDLAATLREAYAKSGYPGLLRARLEKSLRQRDAGKYEPALGIASTYFLAGNKEEGLQWLEKAYDERDSGMVYLNVGSDFDSVRDDPRFQQMVKKVGFPPR